jgi:hypothetical protein
MLVNFYLPLMTLSHVQNTAGSAFAFSTPYLYTGLAFGGDPSLIDCIVNYWNNSNVSANVTSCRSNSAIRICVQDGSTTANHVQQRLGDDEFWTITTAPTTETFYGRYDDDTCNVLAGDEYQVSPNVTRRYAVSRSTENYTTTSPQILLTRREPMALVTRKDDATWSDFVNWVIIGLIYSESKGYAQSQTQSLPDAKYYAEVNEFGVQYKQMLLDYVFGRHYRIRTSFIDQCHMA